MCLLIKIDRYLRHTGMSRSQFGRLSINDPRLVTDRKSTRLNSSHIQKSRMPSSA